MYSRTKNADGSVNTRCLHCLMTVASDVRSTERLERLEQKHLCVEKALYQLMNSQRPMEAGRAA
jgi:hypothetical protein